MSGRDLINMLNNRPLSASELRQIDRRVDRIRRDVREGRPEKRLAEAADPYVVKAFEEDQQKGWDRKPEEWTKVMEHHGFQWYEAQELDAHPKVGPQAYIPSTLDAIENAPRMDPDLADRIERGEILPTGQVWNLDGRYKLRQQPCGQWRNDLHGNAPITLQGAFTLKDLITGFGEPPGGPEAFDKWFSDRAMKFRAAAAGLVLPR